MTTLEQKEIEKILLKNMDPTGHFEIRNFLSEKMTEAIIKTIKECCLLSLPTKDNSEGLVSEGEKKCKHNHGTIYTPDTGTRCRGCNQKMVQVTMTEKEAKQFKQK